MKYVKLFITEKVIGYLEKTITSLGFPYMANTLALLLTDLLGYDDIIFP